MRERFASKLCGILLAFAATAALLLSTGCGGGSNSPANGTPQNGSVNTMLSDAGTPDWANIGIKVLSIAFIPQGGGANVTVYTAPSPAPAVNLAQLDSIEELMGKLSVPAGTYTGAVLTLSGNQGDVTLVVAAQPTSGFPLPGGTVVAANQIQIQGTSGSAGSLTVPLNLNFTAPLVVAANQTTALDVEFDLSHPAFIVGHDTSAGIVWAVNFNGPVHNRRIDDMTKLVLRHIYGSVTAVAADNTSITINRLFPARPVTSPETAVDSKQSLTILADATNGTIFYDLDAKTSSTIKSFAAQASSLTNKFVRVAARYQQDGSLVAVRIWASSTFARVWLDPEGYVYHVDQTTNTLTVAAEDGTATSLSVNGNTQFFFRRPGAGDKDATPIGSGTSFLANLYRGFKVHVDVVDALATPLVAQEVDIKVARFDGTISAAGATGFTDTRQFPNSADNYTVNLSYISGATPNGKDANGNPITGFKWWFFTFPTKPDTGATAIPDFIAATSGAVSFGPSIAAPTVWGESYASWGDSASPNGWSVAWTILAPSPIPLGTVSGPWSASTSSFGMTVTVGTVTSPTVNVDVSTTAGSATLVYQVDKSGTGIVTVSPQDITTSSGLAAFTSSTNGVGLNGTKVKVYGVPTTNGHIKAYVIAYFTGTAPMM